MSLVRTDGVQVPLPRNETRTKEAKRRSKALAMAQFQRLGWSLREIGAYFRVSHTAVKKTIAAIPKATKEHYLERLVG